MTTTKEEQALLRERWAKDQQVNTVSAPVTGPATPVGPKLPHGVIMPAATPIPPATPIPGPVDKPAPHAWKPPVISKLKTGLTEGTVTVSKISPLQSYIKDGGVNLVEIAQARDQAALAAARQEWGDRQVDEAIYIAKTPVTQEQWDRLGSGTRDKCRIIKPLPVEAYNRIPDHSKHKFYIESKPVSADVAARLGPGVLGRTTHYEPSIWESLTPWAEERGETATTKRSLIWGAELVVPGVHLGRHWDDLSTLQKVSGIALDALVMAPAIGLVAKAAIPTSVIVPTLRGEVTVWRGVSLQGKPLFGISERGVTVGGLGIKRPPFTSVTAGYEPVTKLETTVMATRGALKKMGVSNTEIDKAMATLSARGKFAGHKSPFLTSKAPLPTIERLTPEEVGEIFRVVKANAREIDKVYGTASLESQLAPELRLWRPKHDIDIQTLMNADQTEAFTQTILRRLQARGGTSKFRINPNEPGSIEKNINGVWKKVTDIHSREAMPGSEVAAEGAYGMRHAEKAVTISYPGVGKLELMTASEMGKRKLASIMQWRGGTFAPVDYRTKDIVDFYVILRTFKGQKVADKWARIYGFDTTDLLKLAKESPPEFTAWKFIPDTTIRGKSPRITLHPTSGVKAISPVITTRTSVALLRNISPALRTKPSVKISPTASPGVKSARISPTAKTSPGAVADRPSPAAKSPPSKVVAPTSPSSVVPSPKSSPSTKSTPTSPSPLISDDSAPASPHKRWLPGDDSKLKITKVTGVPEKPGIVDLPMGVVKIRVKPPYRPGTKDIEYISLKQPATGKGSPQRGIVVRRGEAPEVIELDQGFTNIRITNGKNVTFRRQKAQRGPGVMTPSGRVQRQRRGSVI